MAVPKLRLALTLAAGLCSAGSVLAAPPTAAETRDLARGRYLVNIGGCNDCHTTGFAPSGGKVPEKDWLLGDAVGFRGDWGTTYPSNLRLYMKGITEAQWLAVARTKEMRPPMPWFNLRAMTDADLRAIYRYTRTLEPAGKPAPAYLPPGQAPTGPVIQFPAAPK